jgi:hypothetical protein
MSILPDKNISIPVDFPRKPPRALHGHSPDDQVTTQYDVVLFAVRRDLAAGSHGGDQRAGVLARGPAPGRPVQVDPIKPKLKPPGTKRLKLNCDILLSTSALKFNLRRYNLASGGAAGVLVLHSPISGYGLPDIARHVIKPMVYNHFLT